MKIWVEEIGEPLPVESTARLHRYGLLLPELVKLGAQVTWWTSTFSHAPRRHFFNHDTSVLWKGVDLNYVHGPGYQRSVSWARIQHQKLFGESFNRLARERIAKGDRPDLILSPIPTLEAASAAVTIGKEFGIPVLVDVRDSWPDEWVDLFPKPARPMARLILRPYFKLADFVFKNATGIIGIEKNTLNYGLNFAKRPIGQSDRVVPMAYQADSLDPSLEKEAEAWWQKRGVSSEKFVVAFFGTIGRFFDFGPVLAVARELKSERPDILFVLCGDGDAFAGVAKQAEGLPNVLLPGWVDAAKIRVLMKLAQAGLANYKTGVKMEMPNKVVEYMAGGLPLVSTLAGESRQILEKEKIGFSYQNESPDSLKQAIVKLADNESERIGMSQRASGYFAARFQAAAVAKELFDHMQSVVASYSSKK